MAAQARPPCQPSMRASFAVQNLDRLVLLWLLSGFVMLLCCAVLLWSADGSKLLLGGSTLTLWDLESQQRISRLTGHPVGGHWCSRHQQQRLSVTPLLLPVNQQHIGQQQMLDSEPPQSVSTHVPGSYACSLCPAASHVGNCACTCMPRSTTGFKHLPWLGPVVERAHARACVLLLMCVFLPRSCRCVPCASPRMQATPSQQQ